MIPIERDCVIEAGKRFCEVSPVAPHDMGIALFLLLGLLLYGILLARVCASGRFLLGLGGMFFLPLLIAATYLAFFT